MYTDQNLSGASFYNRDLFAIVKRRTWDNIDQYFGDLFNVVKWSYEYCYYTYM